MGFRRINESHKPQNITHKLKLMFLSMNFRRFWYEGCHWIYGINILEAEIVMRNFSSEASSFPDSLHPELLTSLLELMVSVPPLLCASWCKIIISLLPRLVTIK